MVQDRFLPGKALAGHRWRAESWHMLVADGCHLETAGEACRAPHFLRALLCCCCAPVLEPDSRWRHSFVGRLPSVTQVAPDRHFSTPCTVVCQVDSGRRVGRLRSHDKVPRRLRPRHVLGGCARVRATVPRAAVQHVDSPSAWIWTTRPIIRILYPLLSVSTETRFAVLFLLGGPSDHGFCTASGRTRMLVSDRCRTVVA